MTTVDLPPLDLAALLCSRVCHDLIGPVAAVINGLELLEMEEDPSMAKDAVDLIGKSAKSAATKLQFCRLAFGASGSAGAELDTAEGEVATRAMIESERIKLRWEGAPRKVAKNKLKAVLNLCLVAQSCVPRGGVVEVKIDGEGDGVRFRVSGLGANPRVPARVVELLQDNAEGAPVDAHTIHSYYAGLLARAAGFSISVDSTPEGVSFALAPVAETQS